MTKQDVKITVSSLNGNNIYFDANISRTIARKIETLLEENDVVILAPYTERKTKIEQGIPV